MNREQAMEYDNELKEQLQRYAREYNLDESTGKYIVDHFVEFIPEENIKGMIFLGDHSVSYKVGNVKMDLKKAIIAGLELAASISKPESIFHYIQLLIVSAFFIEKAAKQELNKLEAYIVYLLHRKDAYNIGVEEERFICEVQEWYREKEGKDIEQRVCVEAIHHLYEIKTADFKNGEIFLKEHVWGKIE